MKLVRKNDEFIVIENNGSYHKVALTEIDELIVLLCEAKRVDPAKANKSIGENLFEEQERTLNIFRPYLQSLDRDYDRVKRVMKMSVSEVWNNLKEQAQANQPGPFGGNIDDIDPLEFGNEFFQIPKDLLLGHKPFLSPGEPFLPSRLLNRGDLIAPVIGIDPAARGSLNMNILKARRLEDKEMKFTVDLEAIDVGAPIPIEEAGLDLTIEVKNGLKYLKGKQKRKRMTEIKKSPYVYGMPAGVKKQDIPRSELAKEFNLAIPRQFSKTFVHPSVDGPKSMLEAFMSSRIPKQYWGHEWKKKTLRNPLLVTGKKITQSNYPVPAVVYNPVLVEYRERMIKLAIDRYVATAFPKRFNPNNVTLPVRYTKDVAYFVLEEGCEYTVNNINDIRKCAVKAWEC